MFDEYWGRWKRSFDLYVGGHLKYKPIYWKNGEVGSLGNSSESCHIYSVSVDDNRKIHAVGESMKSSPRSARYWVDGTGLELTESVNTTESKAYDVAGVTWSGNYSIAKSWCDGVETQFSDSVSEATSLFIIGN